MKSIFHHPTAFKTILDTMLEAVITCDTTGKIVYVNPATSQLFGHTNEELVHKPIHLLMPKYHSSKHNQYMNSYLNTGKAKIIGKGRKVFGKKKNGDLFACWLGLTKFKQDNQQFFTAVISDISELEKTNIKLNELNQTLEQKVETRTTQLNKALLKAEESNLLKSKFLTLASHEFKTPLATILSSAILVRKYGEKQDTFSIQQQKHVHRIEQAVTLMTTILEEFINIEKIERNKIDTQKVLFNIQDVIFEAVELIQPQAKTNQQFQYIFKNTPLKIFTDKHLLLYILINFLSNAVKYSRENETIYIEYKHTSKACFVSIIDQGIGIPENNQKYVFQRFYRADNSKHIDGTGIGLHVSKKYAELIGAELFFESSVNKGSRFTIKLPKN